MILQTFGVDYDQQKIKLIDFNENKYKRDTQPISNQFINSLYQNQAVIDTKIIPSQKDPNIHIVYLFYWQQDQLYLLLGRQLNQQQEESQSIKDQIIVQSEKSIQIQNQDLDEKIKVTEFQEKQINQTGSVSDSEKNKDSFENSDIIFFVRITLDQNYLQFLEDITLSDVTEVASRLDDLILDKVFQQMIQTETSHLFGKGYKSSDSQSSKSLDKTGSQNKSFEDDNKLTFQNKFTEDQKLQIPKQIVLNNTNVTDVIQEVDSETETLSVRKSKAFALKLIPSTQNILDEVRTDSQTFENGILSVTEIQNKEINTSQNENDLPVEDNSKLYIEQMLKSIFNPPIGQINSQIDIAQNINEQVTNILNKIDEDKMKHIIDQLIHSTKQTEYLIQQQQKINNI